MSKDEKRAYNRQFITEHIINYLNPEYRGNYKFKDRGFWFLIEVTKDGYKQLKHNIYVERMELFTK